MIGLICVEEGNAPFIRKYLDLLSQKGIEYEIILWNRNGSQNTDLKNAIVYNKKSNRQISPIAKFPHFLGFSKFVKKRIEEKKYAKIIFLTTLSAYFLPNKIFKNYKNKYILDYRDSSYEYFPFFKKRLSKIINKSSFTCVSSQGFFKILPVSDKYVLTHNYKENELKYEVDDYVKKSKKDVLVVSYIGALREFEYMKSLIDQFAKDYRFILNLHGAGDILKDLKIYAKNYNNVNITGVYVEEEKSKLISESDILCYNYPPSHINNYALANKFYDGLIYKKIMFGDIDTFSGKIIHKEYLGISLSQNDINKNDELYNFYHTLDSKRFLNNAHNYLLKVVDEEKICMKKINDFLEKE